MWIDSTHMADRRQGTNLTTASIFTLEVDRQPTSIYLLVYFLRVETYA